MNDRTRIRWALKEALTRQHPDAAGIADSATDRLWLPGGCTPQSAGCIVDLDDLADEVLTTLMGDRPLYPVTELDFVSAQRVATAVDAAPERVTRAAAALSNLYFQRLDEELVAAHAAGMDLAVSRETWEAVPTAFGSPPGNRLAWTFLRLAPGTMPPLGTAWTVYYSSWSSPAIQEALAERARKRASGEAG